MPERAKVPALGAQGWFTTDDPPALIGSRCAACATYAFPKRTGLCPNPQCRSTDMVETPLSRRGKLWSYTDAQYKPPAPYIATSDEFEPFAIAAVELEAEGLVILGQVVAGIGVDDLTVGTEMELTVGTLFSDDEHDHLIWRWQPTGTIK